jgi:hypothetical protein
LAKHSFFNAGVGVQHVGTLGAIIKDPLDPSARYGISNHHVMCVDMARSVGDIMLQPAPTFLGPFQIDEIGPLSAWAFPENTEVGTLDVAVCRIDLASKDSVVGIGPVSGSIKAEPHAGDQAWPDDRPNLRLDRRRAGELRS